MKLNFLTIFQIFTLLAALAGWSKIIIDWYHARPRLKGRVVQIIRSDTAANEKSSTFVTCVYLINLSKTPVHLVDYQLKIQHKCKWYQWSKWHSLSKITFLPKPKNFSFFDNKGNPIIIPELEKNIIDASTKPLNSHSPKVGWIFFTAPKSFHVIEITKIKLICKDLFNRKYKFITNGKKQVAFNIWMEMVGAQVTIGEKK